MIKTWTFIPSAPLLMLSLLIGAATAHAQEPRPWTPPSGAGRSEASPLSLPRDLAEMPRAEVLWEVPGGTDVARTGDLIIEDGGENGEYVRGVSLATGDELWRTEVPPGSSYRESPRVLDGIVYLRRGRLLLSLDADSGAPLWRREFIGSKRDGGLIDSDLMPCDGGVLVRSKKRCPKGGCRGEPIRHVCLLEGRSGDERWCADCGPDCDLIRCAEEGVLVEPDYGIPALLLARDDGHRIGTRAVKDVFLAPIHEGRLRLEHSIDHKAEVDRIRAVDLDTGKEVWTAAFPKSRAFGHTIVGDHVLVTTAGALRCLDVRTGAARWQVHVSGELLGLLGLKKGWTALSGDRLLVLTEPIFSGRSGSTAQIVLDARDGAVLEVLHGPAWSAATFSANDQVVLCNQDGYWRSLSTTARRPPVRAERPLSADVDAAFQELVKTIDERRNWGRRNPPVEFLDRIGAATWAPLLMNRIEPTNLRAARALAMLFVDVAPPSILSYLNAALEHAAGRLAEDESPRTARELLDGIGVHVGPELFEDLVRSTCGAFIAGADNRGRLTEEARSGALFDLWETVHRFSQRVSRGQDVIAEALAALRPALPCCPAPPTPDSDDTGDENAHYCGISSPPEGAVYDPSGHWALFVGYCAGKHVWLMERKGDRWSGPFMSDRRLTPHGDLWRVRIGETGLRLLVSSSVHPSGGFDNKGTLIEEIVLDPAPWMRDSDGDGWEDGIERRLGTDPEQADSDGDGRPDPDDPSPLCSNRDVARRNADPIRQAVLEYIAAERGSGQPLFFRQDRSGCMEAATPGAPLVFLPAGTNVSTQGGTLMTIGAPEIVDPEAIRRHPSPTGREAPKPALHPDTSEWRNAPAARVEVTEYRNPMDAHGRSFFLRKIRGAWRVVLVRGDWIS